MNYLINTLNLLYAVRTTDRRMVSRLYSLSQRSLIAMVGFVLFVSYYLYPALHTTIIVWGSIIVLITLTRLGLALYFKRYESRYSTEKWYSIFLFFNFMSALGITVLGAVLIYWVNDVQRLFIVASLLGLSAGAVSSLYPDVRIMLGYVTIIILPLIFSLFILGGELHILLAAMLILYFFTQVVIAFNVHKQNAELAAKQQETMAAQTQLLKHREAMEYFYTQAPISIFSYDINLNITECNKAFLELFHLDKKKVIGMNLTLLPDQSPLKVIRAALKDGVQTYVGAYLSTKGLEYWIEAKTFPIHNGRNEVIGGIALLENKTKEHEAVEKLKYLASHDALTQLSNRRGFRTFTEKLLENEKHRHSYSLLFYLDLNRFKYINDSLGHTFGDKLLQEVALRLKSIVEEEHNLTRLGGDEFVIVVPFVAESFYAAHLNAEAYTDKIHRSFEEAFIIDGVRLYIKTSIGIVIIEPNFNNIDEIVRHADISMYQAKKHGQDQISFYNNKLDEERKATFALQQDLIYALEDNLFELYLQPIVSIEDDALYAAEALIRWDHPVKGLLEPADFIPLAIELGVITEIGWWVLEKVCQTITEWKAQGLWELHYISINLNAKQLIKNDFIEKFFTQLDIYNVDTQDIKVEITETSLINNFELTQQVIHELQDRGIKCIIDDFGTGYSSLSYLKKFSFSVLKIDREFIFDLENNVDNEILIRTIVEIAKQFNYSIVVEGIETPEQKEIIKNIDNTLYYQGYLISRPLSIPLFKKKFLSA